MTIKKFSDYLDTTIREIAFNIQRFSPIYRVKRPKPIRDEKNWAISDIVTNFSSPSLLITAKVFEDNGMSLSLMLSLYNLNQHLLSIFLNNGSLVELLSKRFVHGIGPGRSFKETAIYIYALQMTYYKISQIRDFSDRREKSRGSY